MSGAAAVGGGAAWGATMTVGEAATCTAAPMAATASPALAPTTAALQPPSSLNFKAVVYFLPALFTLVASACALVYGVKQNSTIITVFAVAGIVASVFLFFIIKYYLKFQSLVNQFQASNDEYRKHNVDHTVLNATHSGNNLLQAQQITDLTEQNKLLRTQVGELTKAKEDMAAQTTTLTEEVAKLKEDREFRAKELAELRKDREAVATMLANFTQLHDHLAASGASLASAQSAADNHVGKLDALISRATAILTGDALTDATTFLNETIASLREEVDAYKPVVAAQRLNIEKHQRENLRLEESNDALRENLLKHSLLMVEQHRVAATLGTHTATLGRHVATMTGGPLPPTTTTAATTAASPLARSLGAATPHRPSLRLTSPSPFPATVATAPLSTPTHASTTASALASAATPPASAATPPPSTLVATGPSSAKKTVTTT